MNRRFISIFVFAFVLSVCVFSQQTASLRDYVGLINQVYHPGIVAIFEKIKTDLSKKGETDAVKMIDIFLRGDIGTGFIYSDSRGNLYVITNNHVVAHAYSLAITFERQDGYKKKYENLKIIAVDEEIDLAILSFASGDKPVARGLSFVTRAADEGQDVFSAGFPAMGVTPLWQFGRGMVSNASARFPKSLTDETLMGPYIQHTAEIDPGNSGGPLLVAQQGAVTGYAVAGVNTLKATRRQAANYAIPVSRVQPFINDALNLKPATYRAALDERLAKFIEGLGGSKAAYPHIAEYLSSTCVGENAEFAMEEMYEKGASSIRRAFIDRLEEGVVGAMGYAVAWTIENSIRGQGAIKASIKEVTGEGEEYTVVFTINNKDHSSKWIREYGNWRIKSFGTIASGDKTQLEKKQAKRDAADKLRLESSHVEAGYANLFDKAPTAFYATIDYMGIMGAKVYYAGPDFTSFGIFVGRRWGIPVGNVGIMPFFRFGFDYQNDNTNEKPKDDWGHEGVGFPIAMIVNFGVKVTTTYVPGLFIGAACQYNFWDMNDYKKNMRQALCFSAGYAF
jgi:serine protease Do